MKIVSALLLQDEGTWLRFALASRRARNTTLPSLMQSICEKYNLYTDIITNTQLDLPASIFTLDNNQPLKACFIDLYDKPTSKVKNLLINKRREHTLTSCPYCGNPTTPDTLDHFIPKDLLAEYSIFPNNLVPQCRACAPIKSSKYFSDAENSVMFAHPFYSSLLDDVVIEITCTLQDELINFEVVFSTRSEDLNEKLIAKLHIRSLRIKERIIAYCDKEVKKWIRKLKRNNFDIEAVFISKYSISDAHEKRSNWEFILYHSLLDNEDVMNFLKSIQPNEQQEIIHTRELTVLDI